MPLQKSTISLLDSHLNQQPITLPLPGRHSVGLRHFHALDPSRDDVSTGQRQFMVSAWYPAHSSGEVSPARITDILFPQLDESLLLLAQKSELTAEAQEPLFQQLASLTLRAGRDLEPNLENPSPVLIYYPGGQGHRFTNAGICEALASLGYVVFSLDAPRDAPIVVFPDGKIVLQGLGDEDYIWPRVADVQFLLDQLPELNASLFGGQLDLEKIGMFGSSRGGYLSNICAVQDSRIKAAINMDGFLWGLWCEGTGLDQYPEDFQQRARNLKTPILRLLGDQGGSEQARAKFEQEKADFGGPFILATLHGWKHGDFGQTPWLAGAVEKFGKQEWVAAPKEKQERLLELVSDFFGSCLREQKSQPDFVNQVAEGIDVFQT